LGYLTDNLPQSPPGKPIVQCPDLYPYALVVEWEKADPYMALQPEDALALAIRGVLPDVEDWQVSVIRKDKDRKKGHVKFRFHTQAHRTLAQGALPDAGVELVLRSVTLVNPPD